MVEQTIKNSFMKSLLFLRWFNYQPGNPKTNSEKRENKVNWIEMDSPVYEIIDSV